MNFHVYGKGFGLYGYLPAIIKSKYKNLFIKKTYLRFLRKRKDLNQYIKYITFVSKHNLEKKDIIIFAKRPSDQYKFLKRYASKSFYFFLEKPLANNFKKSEELINFLLNKKIKFSIAYLFLYTPWYKKLAKLIENKKVDTIFINWNLKSKNSPKSWKNNVKQGGGIINFYGIHLLALLASLKFKKCTQSFIKKNKNKEVFWNSEFKNRINLKFKIQIHVNSNSEMYQISYLLKNKDKIINFYKKKDPFGKKKKSNLDHRVGILKKYLKKDKKFVKRKLIYLNTIKLWENTNLITKNI